MKCSLYEMTQYVISIYNRFGEYIYCKKGYIPRITFVSHNVERLYLT